MAATAFAERGHRTTRDQLLMGWEASLSPSAIPLREGSDLRPFEALPARLCLDEACFKGKANFREVFSKVGFLVRQTARYPVAALADGFAFRNSVLAGYGFDGWPVCSLVAYLNAWPVRWIHYMRFRDARQGMPQVKIAHLRSLPAPPLCREDARSIERMGEELGTRNTGISELEQQALDSLVGRILGMDSAELERIGEWGRAIR